MKGGAELVPTRCLLYSMLRNQKDNAMLIMPFFFLFYLTAPLEI